MTSAYEDLYEKLLTHKIECKTDKSIKILGDKFINAENTKTEPLERTLTEIVDNDHTDKNTIHSYLELYETLLCSKKYTAKNVLEVGIYKGGSIRLWADYFTNATIYGVDIMTYDEMWERIQNDPRIVLHTSSSAYEEEFVKTNFIDKNIKYDFMLDDGPHTLGSMIMFIRLYSQMLADDGILIIEDVQSWDWIDILYNEVGISLRPYVKCYDLRPIKGRYDDIVFTIDKCRCETF